MKLNNFILLAFVMITITSNAQNVNDTTTSKPKSLIVQKAEKMFAKYLPTILESKGKGAFVDLQYTFVGDFTNDGVDDVIIWFNYSFGGNAVAGMECAFYETVGNDVKVVAGFEPNYMFTISTIKNGIVHAEKIQYAVGDGHCCPSIITPIELIYRDNKIYVYTEKK